jgi:hypothetical protein
MGLMLPPAIQMRKIRIARMVALTGACLSRGIALRFSPCFGAESWSLAGEPGDVPE